MNEQSKSKLIANFITFLVDKRLYVSNYTLTYNEIFQFFLSINKSSIVEYNNQLVFSTNNTIDSCQNNFFIKNFDKIELVTIVGGG